MSKIVDLTEAAKNTKQYVVKTQQKFTSGAVDVIVLIDPRKDTIVQVNAGSNTYDLETTSHAGTGNTDLEDAAVPWILLKNQITDDFHSGQGLNNRGLVGIQFTVAAVTGTFEIYVAQQNLEERPS